MANDEKEEKGLAAWMGDFLASLGEGARSWSFEVGSVNTLKPWPPEYQNIGSLTTIEGEPLSIPDDIGYIFGYFIGVADADFVRSGVAKMAYRITVRGETSEGIFQRCKHIMREADDGQD